MRTLLTSVTSCLILLLFTHASFADGEDYYYSETYFSKISEPSVSCPSGAITRKNSGGILCHKKCESGFTQMPNWCEPKRAKRKSKAAHPECRKKIGKMCTATRMVCRGGWEKIKVAEIPVCFSPCPSGMRGTKIAGVQHCVTVKKKHAVISLKTKLTCQNGFKLNSVGMCVENCRSNFKHIPETNVCYMEKPPAGYTFCGIKGVKSPGFARGFDLVDYGDTKIRVSSKLNCQMMSAGQIYSVASLLSAATEASCPACEAQRDANKAALLARYSDDLDEVESMGPKMLENFDPLLQKLFNVVEDGGNVKSIDFLAEVDLKALDKIMDGGKKVGNFTVTKGPQIPAFYKLATESDPNSYGGKLEMVRNAATIASIFLAIPSIASEEKYPNIDLLGASMDAIATFSYPVWGVK